MDQIDRATGAEPVLARVPTSRRHRGQHPQRTEDNKARGIAARLGDDRDGILVEIRDATAMRYLVLVGVIVLGGCASDVRGRAEADCRTQTQGFSDYYSCLQANLWGARDMPKSRYPLLADSFRAHMEAVAEQVASGSVSELAGRAFAMANLTELAAIGQAWDDAYFARLQAVQSNASNAFYQQQQLDLQRQQMQWQAIQSQRP